MYRSGQSVIFDDKQYTFHSYVVSLEGEKGCLLKDGIELVYAPLKSLNAKNERKEEVKEFIKQLMEEGDLTFELSARINSDEEVDVDLTIRLDGEYVTGANSSY